MVSEGMEGDSNPDDNLRFVGRALDNIFIERLWLSLKYEDIYLKDYGSFIELREGLENYFDFYNYRRLYQSLDYKTPGRNIF